MLTIAHALAFQSSDKSSPVYPPGSSPTLGSGNRCVNIWIDAIRYDNTQQMLKSKLGCFHNAHAAWPLSQDNCVVTPNLVIEAQR